MGNDLISGNFRLTEAFVTFQSGRAYLTAMILQYLARIIRPKVTLIDRHVCHWDVLNSSEGVKGPVLRGFPIKIYRYTYVTSHWSLKARRAPADIQSRTRGRALGCACVPSRTIVTDGNC